MGVIAEQDVPLIVVDDASPESAWLRLQDMLGSVVPDALILRHAFNQGKGAAVITGLEAAANAGYTHVLQVDADGQHDVTDTPRFVRSAIQHPQALICGQPEFDESIPPLRYYARYITLFFAWFETLSTEIRDAMCGIRLYPIAQVLPIITSAKIGRRMTFDTEILVRCVWAGIRLCYIPVKVSYPEGGRSHFHYLRDNLEISWMHTRLIVGMLVRLPRLLARAMFRRTEREPR